MNSADLHILIAEDEITHAVAIRRMLEKTCPGSRIEVVSSIREYQNRISEGAPTIVLLDLNLTDGSTLEMLKSAPAPPPFPVVMMSSYASKQEASESIQAGAADFIIKTPEVFLAIGSIVQKTVDGWSQRTEADSAR